MTHDPSIPQFLYPSVVTAVQRALEEDRATADLTTALLGEMASHVTSGRFLAQGEFVPAGLDVVTEVYRQIGAEEMSCTVDAVDGELVGEGTVLVEVRGPAWLLLSGERVALNFVQHLSGVATATARAVEAVAGTGARIADTRKTIPGLRHLEKYAVRVGGGMNHRSDLAEAVFLKDNHWAMLARGGSSVADFLSGVPDGTSVVVEVDNAEQFGAALDAGASHIMADNQPPEVISEWKAIAGPGVTIEASGGITVDNVRQFAEAGADVISLGALTHSVIAAPIGFELEEL